MFLLRSITAVVYNVYYYLAIYTDDVRRTTEKKNYLKKKNPSTTTMRFKWSTSDAEPGKPKTRTGGHDNRTNETENRSARRDYI